MLLFIKTIILLSGLFATISIVPLYKKKIKMIEEEHDYLFFPSLIFWFSSLVIFLLWLYVTLISHVVHPRYFIGKTFQTIIFSGMVFNLLYVLVVGLKYQMKYRQKDV
jgi:hypothetical protein